MNKFKNGLYIISTPIGNLSDISNRAIEMLSISDFIFCENRNHSNKLLSKLGIKKKLIPLHDHNEKDIIDNYAEKIKDRVVSLISDAGSPLISDPGFKFVSYCIKKKIFVIKQIFLLG